MKKIIILATLVLLTAGQAMAQQAPSRTQSNSNQTGTNGQSSQSVEAITGGW